jgi:thioredoxin-related protein
MILRSLLIAVITCSVFSGGLFSAEQKTPWETDYAAAVQRAEKENKILLLNFTGSDWCRPCKQLAIEVLETPEMAAYGQTRIVMVYLDFPRRQELPPALKAQNEKLAEHFGVDGYPTVLLVTPNGMRLGSLGYMEGGPKTFIRAIERLAAKRPAAATPP